MNTIPETNLNEEDLRYIESEGFTKQDIEYINSIRK